MKVKLTETDIREWALIWPNETGEQAKYVRLCNACRATLEAEKTASSPAAPICVCGHSRSEHLRPDLDCIHCRCPSYKPTNAPEPTLCEKCGGKLRPELGDAHWCYSCAHPKPAEMELVRFERGPSGMLWLPNSTFSASQAPSVVPGLQCFWFECPDGVGREFCSQSAWWCAETGLRISHCYGHTEGQHGCRWVQAVGCKRAK